MIIYVKVHPGSKKEDIVLNNGIYEVWINERAENGKANYRLIEVLSKEFNVNKKRIFIKNPLSRKKIVEIF